MSNLIFLVGDPGILKYWSLSFFLCGFVLLTVAFAIESDNQFIDGMFLVRLAGMIIGIVCVCVAAFVLLLELFIRL